MAELLVKLRHQWMEDIKRGDWKKHQITQEKFDRRSEPGDIVVVRPDGWKWGKREGPPGFVVIKCPELSIEDAKKLEECLCKTVGEESILMKRRKYKLDSAKVSAAVLTPKGILTLNAVTLKSEIWERSLDESNNIIEAKGIS
jgi:hypothetical protein